MIREIFNPQIKRIHPITYSEFKKIGFTKTDYIRYVGLCDVLRSSMILVNHCNSEYASNSCRQDKEKVFTVCEHIFDELLSSLQNFCSPDFGIKDTIKSNYPLKGIAECFLRYSDHGNYFSQNCYLSPNPLYYDIDSFRYKLEKDLSIALQGENPVTIIPAEENFYSNHSVEMLESIKEQVHDYELYDFEPDFPVNSGTTADIQHWAESQERFLSHQEFLLEYEDIDAAVIAKKQDRKRQPETKFDNHKHILYVHSGTLICLRKKHNIIPVTAECHIQNPSKQHDKHATLDINYCCQCKKFFIHDISYRKYRLIYGFLPIFICKITQEGNYPVWDTRAEKSALYELGYTVRKKAGLSTEERHSLLVKIIQHNIYGLSKSDIIRHLENLIRFNGLAAKNCLATSKWEDDLMFLHHLQLDKQTRIKVDEIRHL